ncbi:MAG: hypothetical protein OEN50_00025 [Deltaproteobacteria bacterium]|nr:hypothetical protein [Deltaproteobacteria bacterium]
MLKITKLAETPTRVTLKAEGRLVSNWVSLLEDECSRNRAQEQKVLLDFENVTYVDERGIEMLLRVVTDGIEIANCSALVKSLLKK